MKSAVQHKPDFDPAVLPLSKLYELEQFLLPRPLFQPILCVPASSAPVERIFPRSDLLCVQIVRALSVGNVDFLNVTNCKLKLQKRQ